MVGWSLAWKWKQSKFPHMIAQIMDYLNNRRKLGQMDVKGVIDYLVSIRPKSWDYQQRIEQWKVSVRHDSGIWNVMSRFYLQLIGIGDRILTQQATWLFDLAANNTSYTLLIDAHNPISSDIDFISRITDSKLYAHLYSLLTKNTPDNKILELYEKTLNVGPVSDSVADDILSEKIGITFNMVEGCAKHLKHQYFEMAFIRANLFYELDVVTANRIMGAVCATTVDSKKKFAFFSDVMTKLKLRIKIDSKIFESVLHKIQHNVTHGSSGLTSFIQNIHKLNDPIHPVFFMDEECIIILLKMVKEVSSSKYGFEHILNSFVKACIDLRKAHNKPEIIGGVEIIKLYHECNYQKFPFPIKIEIDMEDFEDLCEFKPDVRLMREAYASLKVKEPPTARCLEAVTTHKNCESALKFLLGVGGKLSIQCIKNIIKHYKSDILDDFKYILKGFIKDQKQLELDARFKYKADAKLVVVPKDSVAVTDENGVEKQETPVSYSLTF